jgi:hypothetical protein
LTEARSWTHDDKNNTTFVLKLDYHELNVKLRLPSHWFHGKGTQYEYHRERRLCCTFKHHTKSFLNPQKTFERKEEYDIPSSSQSLLINNMVCCRRPTTMVLLDNKPVSQ